MTSLLKAEQSNGVKSAAAAKEKLLSPLRLQESRAPETSVSREEKLWKTNMLNVYSHRLSVWGVVRDEPSS